MADLINFLSNSLVTTIVLSYIFAVWLGLTVWTYIDISRRTDNYLYRLIMLMVTAFGFFFGFALYLMIRPTLTKSEVASQTLEEKFLLASAAYAFCGSCGEPAGAEFNFCVNCGSQLKKNCTNCNFLLASSWLACPNCGKTQVPEALPEMSGVVGRSGGRYRLPVPKINLPRVSFQWVSLIFSRAKSVLPSSSTGGSGDARSTNARKKPAKSKKPAPKKARVVASSS